MATRRSQRLASDRASAVIDNDPSSDSDEDMPALAEVSDSDDDESEETSYETDDEDTLHGPCGDKVCGADPPPKPLQTFLGQYVAKLFRVDNQEDDTLFWGEVVLFEPSTKKFSVCFFSVRFAFYFFYLL